MQPIPLGDKVMTQGVAALCRQADWLPIAIDSWLRSHACGACPNLSPDDQRANEYAISNGERVLTSWLTPIPDAPTIWVITEWDRSRTTVLLPDEY